MSRLVDGSTEPLRLARRSHPLVPRLPVAAHRVTLVWSVAGIPRAQVPEEEDALRCAPRPAVHRGASRARVAIASCGAFSGWIGFAVLRRMINCEHATPHTLVFAHRMCAVQLTVAPADDMVYLQNTAHGRTTAQCKDWKALAALVHDAMSAATAAQLAGNP